MCQKQIYVKWHLACVLGSWRISSYWTGAIILSSIDNFDAVFLGLFFFQKSVKGI